ncbi:unnamed protein product [Orchesella dallaii]|uniref:Uncharacterized protein n=1 Tax=Orchesella dallaii TaxID=48710 RepID=A0ABP1QZ65_9HEXA
MENLLEKFGVNPEEQPLIEKNESIILRLGSTKYLKKQQARFIDASGLEQLLKLEIQSNGRVSKAFQLYLPTGNETYKMADDLYACAVDKYLVDATPTQVNQYKR